MENLSTTISPCSIDDGAEESKLLSVYDPTANKGVGRVKITLDDHKFGMVLTAAQRRSGAVFNRFGLANIRGGGHSVEFYLDDISYTVRRTADARPKFVKQTYVKVPYPHEQGGRRH